MSGSYIPQPWNASDPVIVNSAMQAALIAYLGEDHVWTAQQSFADFYLLDNGTATYKAVDIFNGSIRVNGTAIGGGSLTVTEVDGAPSVTATTLRFPNGTVTDAGGGIAALSVLPASVTKAELNTAVSDGNVVYVGDGLNGTLGATTPASVAATTAAFSGQLTSTLNGAASTPPVLLTGTWFTGGTSTTTKPQLLVEPTGTTSTGWNTAGTAIGVNSGSSFAGYLLDLQKNGVTKLSVDTNGTLLSAFGVTAAGSIGAGTGFYSNVGLGVQSSNTSVKLANNGALSSANTFAALVTNNSAMTQTSGSNGCLQITPTYNQTSGTAANTDLLINRTQTAVGSGSQLLIDAQVGSISKFKVDNNGGLTASGTVSIGSGTPIARVLSATATLDFPSIASNDTHTLTITVTGAVAGDSVFLGCPAGLDAGLIFCASVTATNTVTVRMHNSSGGSTDPASGTFRATVMQF